MPNSHLNGDSAMKEALKNVDLEIMKAEMATMREAVQGVSSKLDIMIQMQVSITQLQERSSAQQSAMDRAFVAINETKQRADAAVSENSKMMSFVKGGAAVGAILFAFTQWYVMGQIRQLEDTSKALLTMDRRIMYIESKIWPEIPVPGGNPNVK